MPFMLDTPVAAALIRGDITEACNAQLAAILPQELCVSAVTRAELLLGLMDFPEHLMLRRALSSFFQIVRSLAWDDAAADEYARVRPQAVRDSAGIGELDIMVAAHAVAVGATLVTDRPGLFASMRLPTQVLQWEAR
ncbi:PIN domain-containing protein [Chromobacterium haemolyticum]|uniref:PIN domain-containing protein n=1 Tax=Chromobacterium haemolyticum TaxID=394935 RepID=UPI001A917D73|nr:PIN domain-containing protein [Chromobacterium haemolyticum]MBO0501508.1 PIN domain-containing protein [Chromobacterium haemolyticum]